MMYGNESKHINAARKDPKKDMGAGLSREPLCWRPKGSELKENFQETRQIIYAEADKKGPGRFSRSGPAASSSSKEGTPKSEKGRYLTHTRGGAMFASVWDLAKDESSPLSRKAMDAQPIKPPIKQGGKSVPHQFSRSEIVAQA